MMYLSSWKMEKRGEWTDNSGEEANNSGFPDDAEDRAE
jgi:hypothetical protein